MSHLLAIGVGRGPLTEEARWQVSLEGYPEQEQEKKCIELPAATDVANPKEGMRCH